MQVRALVMYTSLIAFVGLIVLEFFFPAVSTYVLFGLLGWFVASLFVYRLPVMSRTIGGSGRTGPAPAAGPSPALPSGSPALLSDLDFCLYCASPIERGVPKCPQCGRSLPPAS